MRGMQLDHLSYAAGPHGLAGTAERLSELLGEKFIDGGIHPRFGTSNMIMPLTDGCYLEVVEVLDHPASDKAPFGQAVRARTKLGGGWLAWVVRVDDITKVEQRLQRSAVRGNRHRPDGVELRWKQIGLRTLVTEPALPFFVEWETPDSLHPSQGATGHVTLSKLEVSEDPRRVAAWLDTPPDHSVGDFEIAWVPGPPPGVVAASFSTPEGVVRIT
jgi:glyoxalase-like protein